MRYTFTLILLALSACNDPDCFKAGKKMAEVIKIGGCDGYGWCGVQYADRDFGIEKFPIVGKRYCK